MTHDNKLVVVFLFLYWEGKTPSQAKIEKLRGDITIAVQNVIGGSVERVEDAMYADIAKVFENQMLAVKEILRREDVFSGTTIEEDVATFYNLGISSLYFGQNNPAQIAKHLTSFIGAKRAATVSGSNPSPGSRIDYGVMSFHHVEGREGVFFCLDADKEKAGLVQKINEYKGECPAELTTAVTMFRSKQPLIHGKCLVMALAVQSRFLRAAPASGVPDIWEVSSASFLRTKSRKSRAKYEEMLQAASGMLHPISDVQKRTRHPGHVVMFVYPQGAPEGGIQFLNDITALLKLQISQLFAETFSNGMVTYNVYVEAAKGHEVADEADMARKILSLQRRMTTLAVLPRAALANNTDAFDPRAKLYLGCAQVFASHFIDNGRVVRAEQLLKANAAQNRLDRMGKVMLQDTVTCSRFNQTMQTHPELALAVYDDFVRTRTPDDGPPAQRTLPPLNEELRRRVKEHVTGVDQEIFNACLLFNSAIYKTNFFSREKAATSFRLCPSLFISSEVYPEVPHAIFLIVGASFEGFHVRFRDIARGGIRAIASAGETHGKKQQALFEETYNLAYTQQLNVPEGGSKGTILLNPDACAQASASAAYKAYTDALLDLLLPDAQVPDLLGDDEILFFSADEATPPATVAWAEHHARKRGYPFWKTVACEPADPANRPPPPPPPTTTTPADVATGAAAEPPSNDAPVLNVFQSLHRRPCVEEDDGNGTCPDDGGGPACCGNSACDEHCDEGVPPTLCDPSEFAPSHCDPADLAESLDSLSGSSSLILSTNSNPGGTGTGSTHNCSSNSLGSHPSVGPAAVTYSVDVVSKPHGRGRYIGVDYVAPGERVVVRAQNASYPGVVRSCRRGTDKGKYVGRVVRTAEPAREAAQCVTFVNREARERGVPIVCKRAEFQADRKKVTLHCVGTASKPDFRPLLKPLYTKYRCRIWFDTTTLQGGKRAAAAAAVAASPLPKKAEGS